MRTAKSTESYFLFANCVNAHQIAFNSRFIEFLTFKRCFQTCSKVMRIAILTESYFLLANCVNAHLLSDFLRRYFGLIKCVTKSVTICPPPPSTSSKRLRIRLKTQIVEKSQLFRITKVHLFSNCIITHVC